MLRLDRVCARSLSRIWAILALASVAIAQEPPPSFEVARRFDSGWVTNTSGSTQTIASFPVRVAGASWMRLAFQEIHLPPHGARLRITSVEDGAQQELDARGC